MSKLWRCTNPDCADDSFDGATSYDFVAPEGVCPKCGTSRAENPDAVIPRATIHYLVVDPKGPILTRGGRRLVACQPESRKLPLHATSVASVVTCPACLESKVLKDHVEHDTDNSGPRNLKFNVVG